MYTFAGENYGLVVCNSFMQISTMSRKLLVRLIHLRLSMRFMRPGELDETLQAVSDAIEKYNMEYKRSTAETILRYEAFKLGISKHSFREGIKLADRQLVLRSSARLFQIIENQPLIFIKCPEDELTDLYQQLLFFDSMRFQRLEKYSAIQLGYYLHLTRELIDIFPSVKTGPKIGPNTEREKKQLIGDHDELVCRLDDANNTTKYSRLFICTVPLEMLDMFPVVLGKIILGYAAPDAEDIINRLLTLPEFYT